MSIKPQTCAFHPHQNLVNFCRNSECLLPMCPSCVKIHTAQHVRLNTHGIYDCISDLHEEVQSTINVNLNALASKGKQLAEIYKGKHEQRNIFINKMKEMRIKIIENVNKYIDGLEQHIINQLKSIENVAEEQFKNVGSTIQKIRSEIEMENESLKGEKSMKAIINHISANLPEYYSFNVSEISQKVNQIKNFQLHIQREFQTCEINESLRQIGQCYNLTFLEPIKRRSAKRISLVDSNVSRESKGLSTQCSQKKLF